MPATADGATVGAEPYILLFPNHDHRCLAIRMLDLSRASLLPLAHGLIPR